MRTNTLVPAKGTKEVYSPLGRRKNKGVVHICVGGKAGRRSNLLMISVYVP